MHSMDHLSEDTYTNLQKSERYQDAVYETIQLKPAAITRGVSTKRNAYVPLSACLGLLCVAAVAAIVYFCVRHTAVKNQLGQLHISNNNLTKETNRLRKIITEYERDCCPLNWWKHSTSCYFVSATKGIWNESRKYCREKGGDLVVINSKEEQTFLNYIVKVHSKEIWIDLTDRESEGVWKWVDGTPLTQSLKMWRAGEPNDSDGNEDCAVFVRRTPTNPQHSISGGHPTTLQVWNDVPCFRSRPFICDLQRPCQRV